MGNKNLLTFALLVMGSLAYQGAATKEKSPAPAASALARRPGGASASPGRDAARLPGEDLLHSYAENLVVIVPDPVRTNLSLKFDTALDGIISGAQSQGYILQTYFMPWRISPFLPTEDPQVKTQQENDQRRRETLPAILVFSKGNVEEQLGVFLVAESPTAGVDKRQLAAAGAAIRGNYSLVGPTFSGSLASLDALRKSPGILPWTYEFGTAVTQLGPSAPSALYRDQVAWAAVKEYLRDQGNRDITGVRVSESETAFGESEPDANGKKEHTIHFPRNISRVRNAYKDAAPAADPAAGKFVTASPGLPLILRDSGEGATDASPGFSADHTPLSEEAVLAQIGRLLREERRELVEVAATDPLDSLFVAKFLRTAYPDGRLLWLDSDLLFARAVEDLPLTGVLSVSAFPLIPALHPNTPIFASATQGAFYDAVKLALGHGKSQPSADDRPHALWLTALGRDGYWPVARLKPGSGDQEDPDFRADSISRDLFEANYKPQPTRGVRNIMVAFFAGCLIWAAILVCAQIEPWRAIADMRICDLRPQTAGRIANLLTITVGLLSISIVSTSPLRVVDARGAALWWGNIAITTLGVVAGLLTLALMFRKAAPLSPSRIPPALQMMATLLAGVATWGLWRFTLRNDEWIQGFFAAWRSLDFTSGVTPLLPVLLLMPIYVFWAWKRLQHHIFIDEREQGFPLTGDPIWQEVVAPAYCRVLNATRRLIPGHRAVVLALCIALGWLVYRGTPLRTFEPHPFDWMYRLMLAVAIGLLIFTLARFHCLWMRLHGFLVALEDHPVRAGLSLLPGEHSWSPVWQHSARRRNYKSLTAAVDVLTALNHSSAPALRTALQAILAEHSNGRRESQAQWDTLSSEFVTAHECVAKGLAAYWSQGDSESMARFESSTKTRDAARLTRAQLAIERPEILAQEFIALRCVTFVRYIMLRLRDQLGCISSSGILIALSLNSYPFQAPRLIGWCVVGAFAAIGALVVSVLIAMHRDAILSRISNTKANKLDRHFVFQLAEAGALPMLALISTTVPEIGRFFFSWIEPALSAFKG
jgi:hypothetical protein